MPKVPLSINGNTMVDCHKLEHFKEEGREWIKEDTACIKRCNDQRQINLNLMKDVALIL